MSLIPYLLWLFSALLFYPFNSDKLLDVTHHIMTRLFLSACMARERNALHVHFCTKSQPKYLAVISFFRWPLGHLALSQSLMNNEQFDFKQTRVSTKFKPAFQRWLKHRCSTDGKKENTKPQKTYLGEITLLSEDVYLKLDRGELRFLRCGIFVKAGR